MARFDLRSATHGESFACTGACVSVAAGRARACVVGLCNPLVHASLPVGWCEAGTPRVSVLYVASSVLLFYFFFNQEEREEGRGSLETPRGSPEGRTLQDRLFGAFKLARALLARNYTRTGRRVIIFSRENSTREHYSPRARACVSSSPATPSTLS